MHMAVRITSQTNPKLFNQMLNKIGDFEIYSRTFDRYQNIYVNPDGTPKYHNVRTLGKTKFFKTTKDTSNNVLENIGNSNEIISASANSYRHGLFVGIETLTSEGKKIIPVPLQQNTLLVLS